jgi:hypothetical protein
MFREQVMVEREWSAEPPNSTVSWCLDEPVDEDV